MRETQFRSKNSSARHPDIGKPNPGYTEAVRGTVPPRVTRPVYRRPTPPPIVPAGGRRPRLAG